MFFNVILTKPNAAPNLLTFVMVSGNATCKHNAAANAFASARRAHSARPTLGPIPPPLIHRSSQSLIRPSPSRATVAHSQASARAHSNVASARPIVVPNLNRIGARARARALISSLWRPDAPPNARSTTRASASSLARGNRKTSPSVDVCAVAASSSPALGAAAPARALDDDAASIASRRRAARASNEDGRPSIARRALTLTMADDDAPPALAAPSANDADATKLDVQTGARVALDGLGPIVVGVDGTMSRISNWTALSERERETALRRLAKRNNERLEALKSGERSSEACDG